MRYIIRVVILVIAFIIMMILKKCNKLTKQQFITYMSALLFIIAMPIDDLFMRFSTPEAYMKYNYFYTRPQEITYGKESCLVRATDDVNRTIYIHLRSENGIYKMNYGNPAETIKSTNFGMNGKIDTVRVNGTNDYYLTVYLLSNNFPIEIELDDGNELKLENNYTGNNYTLYRAQMYIEDYREGRYIIVNGDKVSI